MSPGATLRVYITSMKASWQLHMGRGANKMLQSKLL